jgi:hypothetical protein
VIEFTPFEKIPRYRSSLCITEKIDGVNAQVKIIDTRDLTLEQLTHLGTSPYCIDSWHEPNDTILCMLAGSRKRWIAPEGSGKLEKGCDNYAFAQFVRDNCEDLRQLGPGAHYGEWWGGGIARKYGRAEKTFSLFNAVRWNPNNPNKPDCCSVVDIMDTENPAEAMMMLKSQGSMIITDAGTRFHKPEGIIVYHSGSKSYFKQTFEFDKGKWSE